MSDKFQALDALLLVNPDSLSDDDRTHWAQRWAVLEQAAAGGDDQDTVSIDKVLHVLDVLVRTANPDSLRTDQSVSQLMAKTKLAETTVKRCLRLLRDSGLVPVLSNGGGPKKRPAVRWLQFVDEYRQRSQAAVDNSRTQAMTARTQATEPRTQATSGPPYSLSTEPPTPVAVSAEARAVTGPRSGGQEKAREGTATADLWVEQVARAAAERWLQRDSDNGLQPRSREALISKRLPECRNRAQEWVKHWPHVRQVAAPTSDLWHELVTAVCCMASGEGANPVSVRWLQDQLTQRRPALGVAL
jgi:hypothetical protein